MLTRRSPKPSHVSPARRSSGTKQPPRSAGKSAAKHYSARKKSPYVSRSKSTVKPSIAGKAAGQSAAPRSAMPSTASAVSTAKDPDRCPGSWSFPKFVGMNERGELPDHPRTLSSKTLNAVFRSGGPDDFATFEAEHASWNASGAGKWRTKRKASDAGSGAPDSKMARTGAACGKRKGDQLTSPSTKKRRGEPASLRQTSGRGKRKNESSTDRDDTDAAPKQNPVSVAQRPAAPVDGANAAAATAAAAPTETEAAPEQREEPVEFGDGGDDAFGDNLDDGAAHDVAEREVQPVEAHQMVQQLDVQRRERRQARMLKELECTLDGPYWRR